MEIWKDIEGYEDVFQVSNEGRVRRKRDGKIKRISMNSYKYPFVRLTNSGRKKNCSISHLVANAFIQKEGSSRFVIHKDGNVYNNIASNLYWSKTNANQKNSRYKSVVVYKPNGVVVGEYISMSAAASDIGVSVSEISRCCNGGSRKSSRGYFFKIRKNEKRNCKV